MHVPVATYPGRLINIEGSSYRYFGGTSYLGVQTDPEFQELTIRTIRTYGSNYGASRRSNIQLQIYEQAERALAHWTGSESCVTMSSGYLAGQLVASHFNNRDHKLFYAPNTHSALYQSNAKPYTTYTSLNIALREHLDQERNEIPVVFIDTIDFSGCNYPTFEILKSLPLSSCILVADDSHGIGVVGMDGSGVFRTLSALPCKELVLCASLGKALGLQAGVICGTEKRLERIKTSDFFGGASPAAPFYLANFLGAMDLYKNKRQQLQKNIVQFLSGLKNDSLLNYMPHYPVFGYSESLLTAHLRKAGIIVTDFRYPTEDAYATSRIVLTAAHEKDDIEILTTAINTFV